MYRNHAADVALGFFLGALAAVIALGAGVLLFAGTPASDVATAWGYAHRLPVGNVDCRAMEGVSVCRVVLSTSGPDRFLTCNQTSCTEIEPQ
jgi:hypothetical protein